MAMDEAMVAPLAAFRREMDNDAMNVLRNLLDRAVWSGRSPFQRYYGDVLQAGAGYPTADEARRDLRQFEKTTNHLTWGH